MLWMLQVTLQYANPEGDDEHQLIHDKKKLGS